MVESTQEETTVNTETITITVGKESKEVAVALHDLVVDIKAGKELAVIAAENLPTLLAAVEGADKLGAEMDSVHRNATVAYLGMKLADALI